VAPGLSLFFFLSSPQGICFFFLHHYLVISTEASRLYRDAQWRDLLLPLPMSPFPVFPMLGQEQQQISPLRFAPVEMTEWWG
jgi:hypothetical protein